MALATATDAIRNFEKLPQRKALIYVSNGYDLSLLPGSPVATATPPRSGPPRDVSAPRAPRVREQLWELPRLASRAGVTIFAIDARILDVVPLPDPNVDSVAWQRHLTTTRDTLRAIAEGAGGFAVVDEGDVVETLKRISRRMHD